MHSNMMHTVRLLTVSRSIITWGEGGLPVEVCLDWGLAGWHVPERGGLPGIGSSWRGVCMKGRLPPPPEDGRPGMNRMTNTCKNITFPILRMRAVINVH